MAVVIRANGFATMVLRQKHSAWLNEVKGWIGYGPAYFLSSGTAEMTVVLLEAEHKDRSFSDGDEERGWR